MMLKSKREALLSRLKKEIDAFEEEDRTLRRIYSPMIVDLMKHLKNINNSRNFYMDQSTQLFE